MKMTLHIGRIATILCGMLASPRLSHASPPWPWDHGANPLDHGAQCRRGGTATFDSLGDLPGGNIGSTAYDVSDSGEVVVGSSLGPAGVQAVRWTRVTGLRALTTEESTAWGVSPDGKLVVGYVAKPNELPYETGRAAVIWRGRGPYEILAGGPILAMAPLFVPTQGKVVLNDGRVFGTCIQYGAYREPLACRFDAPTQVERLPGSYIFAADDAGNYAGTQVPGRRQAYGGPYALYNGAFLAYPAGFVCNTFRGCDAEARAFSADGAVIVGTSQVPAPGQESSQLPTLYPAAFVFTQAKGTLVLEDLEDGDDASGAYAISADGRVIAGYGTDADGTQATVWVEHIPIPLVDVLLEAAGHLPRGWRLSVVHAMSPDGRTLVGSGINPDGYSEGFRVVLPHAL